MPDNGVLDGYVISSWAKAPTMLQPNSENPSFMQHFGRIEKFILLKLDGGRRGIFLNLQIQCQDKLLKF